MEVTLRTHRICLSPALRRRVERELQSALEPAAALVEAAEIWLIDATGTFSGKYTRCRLSLQPVGGDPIEVSATGAQIERAVRHAARRSRDLLMLGDRPNSRRPRSVAVRHRDVPLRPALAGADAVAFTRP